MSAPTTTSTFICERCNDGNHELHAINGACGVAKTVNMLSGPRPTSTKCACLERPAGEQAPVSVLHTHTSPLHFPTEITQHILELAQEHGQGSVELHFDGGLLKAWKLTTAGRSPSGFDTTSQPAVN